MQNDEGLLNNLAKAGQWLASGWILLIFLQLLSDSEAKMAQAWETSVMSWLHVACGVIVISLLYDFSHGTTLWLKFGVML